MVKRHLPGFMVGLLFAAACSHAQYQHYGVAPPPGESLKGSLLGPEPKDDRPLSDCDPTAVDRGPCIVLFREVWERAQTDLIELKQRLKACEDG